MSSNTSKNDTDEKNLSMTLEKKAEKSEDLIYSYCAKLMSYIKKIIKKVSAKLPDNADIDRLQRILQLATQFKEPDYIMRRVAPKMWKFKNDILNKNGELLFSDSFGEDMVKADSRQDMIKRLMKTIKKMFLSASEEEKNGIWDDLKSILLNVLLFLKEFPKDEAAEIVKNFQVDDTDSEEDNE